MYRKFCRIIILLKTNLTISFVKSSIRVTKKIMMSKFKLVLTVYESRKNTLRALLKCMNFTGILHESIYFHIKNA